MLNKKNILIISVIVACALLGIIFKVKYYPPTVKQGFIDSGKTIKLTLKEPEYVDDIHIRLISTEPSQSLAVVEIFSINEKAWVPCRAHPGELFKDSKKQAYGVWLNSVEPNGIIIGMFGAKEK